MAYQPKRGNMLAGMADSSILPKYTDDLHKPQLDGIGYQDLLTQQMHGRALLNEAIGKQPAWLNYMTAVNQTYADFAAGEAESYMVLNRVYDVVVW